MQYLKIENPGVAPVECFTLLGCSTSRFSNNDDVTGQFGSGLKHAINILLYQGYKFYIYSGNTCLEFFTKPKEINDGITSKVFQIVWVKIGQKEKELGWTLEHGSLDWKDVSMACREFVSNCLDRCVKEGTTPTIELVEEKSVRAKRDHTRIFLGLEGGIVTFYATLEKRFLNLRGKTPTGTLDKKNRNLSGQGAVVYRKGILVRETSEHTPSLFDYNVGNELYIDECRNANDYDVLYAATANLLFNSSYEQKLKFIKQLVSEKTDPCWEETLSLYAGKSILSTYSNKLESIQKDWTRAWKEVCTQGTILTDVTIPQQTCFRLNLKPVFSKSPGWIKILTDLGLPTCYNSLSEDDKKGKEVIEASPQLMDEVKRVWSWLDTSNLTQGKPFPSVKIFREASSKQLGYYSEDIIYINEEIVGKSQQLTSTILEELVHYVTGFPDYCHDLQTYLFNIITKAIPTQDA